MYVFMLSLVLFDRCWVKAVPKKSLTHIFALHPHLSFCHYTCQLLSLQQRMPLLSAEHKNAILLEYIPRSSTHSFAALAHRHAVRGGEWVVRSWYRRWDGTPASLEMQPRSGRPRILSKAEVSRHVRAPILAANRVHRAVHYTTLLHTVKAKTGKELSLRTLRRYGKDQLGARHKRTKKRTADESKSNYAYARERAHLLTKHTS